MADFSTIARPYARALFEVATRAGELAGWSTALAAAAAVVADARAAAPRDPRAATPSARSSSPTSANDVPDAKLLGSAHGSNLLRLLAENDRLPALPEIAAQFDS
jgi:F-type H+-transporting ATPase subunit delta